MAQRDYYDLLGVQRDASSEDIKKAYRQLARKYHPDVSHEPDAEDRFKEINTAYEILSNEEKRRLYDRFGHAGVSGNGGMGGGFGGAGFAGFEDIFEDLFTTFTSTSRTRQRRGPRPGRDLAYEMIIDFEEAIFGAEKEIEVKRLATCETCNGSGAEPGTHPTRCPECDGTGEVRTVRQTLLGSMINVSTCPRCRGRGEIVTTPCDNCGGTGQEEITRHLKVNVPPGVDEGTRIRIPGEGEPGVMGGPSGNLYVIIRVREHEYFQRRGDDILYTLAVNVAQAALGGEIAVPTPDGETEIEIKPGTQTGDTVRLRGHGFPHLRRDGTTAGRGDMHVIVTVVIPRKLTDEQRELFEALAETLDTVILPRQQKGFFDRVMDFLSGE